MIRSARSREPLRNAGPLAFGSLLVVLFVVPQAQGAGISIGWDDCRSLGAAGSLNKNFGCLSVISELPLFVNLNALSRSFMCSRVRFAGR